MKRDVSYSDSFLYLSDNSNIILEPLFSINKPEIVVEPEVIPDILVKPNKTVLFIIKGSLHIFFISAFETFFYFLYVSKSEDNGILNTINTYYMPFINSCNTWSNKTRELLLEILENEIDKNVIDTKGIIAFQNREETNNILLHWSIGYSGICAALFSLMIGIVYWKKIPINWLHLFSEHIAFVVLLGLYEFFFFRTIIYKYQTISTDELNQYIIDGAFQCLAV